ncbi:MAG: hypothetical protein ACRDKT_13025 [Actinomycetota bacterium]
MKHDEAGSALIETFLLALVLLVPLLWALGILAELHRGALATSAAAREAGMEAARSADAASAERAVTDAVHRALIDHGVDPSRATVRWSTDPGFPRGAAVEVVVTYPVTVTQAPLLGEVAGPAIVVRASHVARIDPYAGR